MWSGCECCGASAVSTLLTDPYFCFIRANLDSHSLTASVHPVCTYVSSELFLYIHHLFSCFASLHPAS